MLSARQLHTVRCGLSSPAALGLGGGVEGQSLIIQSSLWNLAKIGLTWLEFRAGLELISRDLTAFAF